MVSHAGWSTGCDTCRARKVKCSFEKPYCHRCRKAGVRCLGYLRRPRAELSLVKYRAIDKAQHDASPEELWYDDRDRLQGPLSWPVSDRSMNFFLSQFIVISEPATIGGWFEFVPQVLRDHDTSTSLRTAFQAVSLLSFANRYHRDDLTLKALDLNGRALGAVNESLASPESALDDGVFAAILLLCLFGHINGDLRLQVGVHTAGLYRLVAMRNAKGWTSPYSGSFERHIMALLHLDNNDRYISCQPVSEVDFGSPSPLHDSKDLFERLLMLWPRSAALATHLHDLMKNWGAHIDNATILELLKAAQEFDLVVCHAADNLDDVWQVDTRSGRTVWSHKALIYRNSWTMAIWHAYRITRIHLHTAVADIYQLLEQDLSVDRSDLEHQFARMLKEQSLAIIDSMNEDICASLPCSLAELDLGHEIEQNTSREAASRWSLSIAGLRAVANGRYTSPNHALHAKLALTHIAQQLGIKAALA